MTGRSRSGDARRAASPAPGEPTAPSVGGAVLQVVVPYAVVGALWIAFSDALLEATTPAAWWDELQTVKGLLFVAVTAFALAALVGRREERLRQGARRLEAARADNRRMAERLRLLARRVLEVQESERTRLARDLHDELGQRLTVAKLALDGDGPGPDLDKARLVLTEALATVRRLSVELRPPMLESLGLPGALRWMAERAGAELTLAGPPRLPLEPDARLVLYRVAQEAMTNVLRHAGTRRLQIQVGTDAEAVELVVTDEGRGFDPDGRVSGVGLLGMRERVEALGGSLTVLSAPGRGTRIVVRVPPASQR